MSPDKLGLRLEGLRHRCAVQLEPVETADVQRANTGGNLNGVRVVRVRRKDIDRLWHVIAIA